MDAVWKGEWFDAQTHVSTALAYMKNEPVLEKIQQDVLRKISEMGFFEKIWRQNKIIVIIAIALIVLILVVLKIAFTPSSSEREAVAPAAKPASQPAADKTRLDEVDGTVLESDITGSLTVLIKGEEKGVYNITSNGVIIGRDPNAVDVYIADPIVSKTHLKIIPRGGQFFIADLGSTNGTFVNGEKIKETLVNPDDMVQLGKKGDVKLVFKK